jgi:hypothetical protein
MKTRRRGGMEPRNIIRSKQIRGVQYARRNDLYSFGHRIGSNPGRPSWAGPSNIKLGHLQKMVTENNRLLKKGKGRSRTRRN